MCLATGVYSGLRVIHVAIAGISIIFFFWQSSHPSGLEEAAASGCGEGFGYDSFEEGKGECGRMTGTPRRCLGA